MKLNTITNKIRCQNLTHDGSIVNYKNMLIKFLIRKNKIISERTHILFITQQDLGEILTYWSQEDCKNYLSSMTLRDDASNCPWCIRQNNRCVRCQYGERHRVCGNPNSTYSKIKNVLDRSRPIPYESIVDIPEVRYLSQSKNKAIRELRNFEIIVS